MIDTIFQFGEDALNNEASISIDTSTLTIPGLGDIIGMDELKFRAIEFSVPEKEINLILDGCDKTTVWNAVEIGKAFRGRFLISFEGYGTVGLYNPNSGIVITVAKDEISITTDDESFDFEATTSGVKSAIQQVKKELR